MNLYELQPRFAKLFSGLDTAFGYNSKPPRWIKRPPRREDYLKHLQGEGFGIGIAPLRPDNTVLFAAIDLDEPDFEAAREMQEYLPGRSFIERSKSGNAHVWVFFEEPVEAWVAMGVLREATIAAGKKGVEVFPKNWDFARVRLGNYINLPYHGDTRKVVSEFAAPGGVTMYYTLEGFVTQAEQNLNVPEKWRRRAHLLQVPNPADRDRANQDFGTQQNLHMCAEWIIEGNAPPISDGHRNAVFFALARQLSNWALVDSDEALDLLRSVNDEATDKTDDSELRRILGNAERGQYTSTGCDDPLFAPYAHPNCPIAQGR